LVASATGLGLSELARLGFSDLAGTVAKLDKLVSLVGDPGRAALAPLSQAANPDQALNALIEFAESDKSSVKALLKNPESAKRVCLTFGASSAMVDLVRRQPSMLSVFDKSETKLPSTDELTKRFQAALKACPTPVATDQAWPAIRLVYRRELLRLAAFDVSHAHQQEAFAQVAAHLSDLASVR
jgi:glutamate-ammonia-ligase adenylyltransferase